MDQEREGKLKEEIFSMILSEGKPERLKNPREQLALLRNKFEVANRGTAFLMRINR